MLANVNPVNSVVTKIKPAQPGNPEARVYVSKDEVWSYGLFPAGNIVKNVRVPCVYNYPPWDI